MVPNVDDWFVRYSPLNPVLRRTSHLGISEFLNPCSASLYVTATVGPADTPPSACHLKKVVSFSVPYPRTQQADLQPFSLHYFLHAELRKKAENIVFKVFDEIRHGNRTLLPLPQ